MSCPLCIGLVAVGPAGVSVADIEAAYAIGFADGVRCAMTSVGPLLCEKHGKLRDAALAARGLKIGRDPNAPRSVQ